MNFRSQTGGIQSSPTYKFDYGNELSLKKYNVELHKQFSDLLDSEVTLCSNNSMAPSNLFYN